jgi:hypothetical protein
MVDVDENDGSIEGVINPGRVLHALGAIGYTPESAICDIVDNSITHGHASRIWIELVTEPGIAENRRNNASHYIVADDGGGLDDKGLDNALALGSEPVAEGSLGKFGMGLKSAGLSQGRRITLLSRREDGPLLKRALDCDHVDQVGRYEQLAGEPTSFELEVWERFLGQGETGTIVIIDKTHKENQPSIKSTRQELERELGIIYYYFLSGEDAITIHLEGQEVAPFDPLFAAEADENGDLDERHWDGRSSGWLSRAQTLTIDPEKGVTVEVEMTQLPHPPSFEDEQAAARSRYMIGAGNYGFYVYRNRRLIARGERFTDIVPYDQDYYSFRGRILIADDADAVLNIDVKKSRVLLSEDARSALSDHIYEPRMKSKAAWERAGAALKQRLGANSQVEANERLATSEEIDVLPSEPDSVEIEERRTERRKAQTASRPVTAEERERAVNDKQRVLLEDFLLDNVVWERAYDAGIGTIVRLNGAHRFVRHVFQHYAEDFRVTLVLNALFLCLARTESYAVTNMDQNEAELEAIFEKMRQIFGEEIGRMTMDVLEPELTDTSS